MKKKKVEKVKKYISKKLRKEIGVLGFASLMIIGFLICSYINVWADNALTYAVVNSAIAYV